MEAGIEVGIGGEDEDEDGVHCARRAGADKTEAFLLKLPFQPRHE